MATEKIYPKINLKEDQKDIISKKILELVLSANTITLLNKYVNDKDFNEQQKLWNELLLDSICILKINDLRERYNKQFSAIFKNNAEITKSEEFVGIRKYCTYGIEDLDKYFNDFMSFEGVLYGTDKNYRDHVNHVIQVWLMGIWFLDENINNFNFSDGITATDFDYSFEIDKTVQDDKSVSLFISKSEVIASWTIIALCHDLGYPLEKATKLNEKLKIY